MSYVFFAELSKNLSSHTFSLLAAVLLIVAMYFSKFKNKWVISIVILLSSLRPTQLSRYEEQLEFIRYRLYLEPVSLTGIIVSYLPSSTPGSSEIEIYGYIGNSSKIEEFKVTTPDFLSARTSYLELGTSIKCRLDSSNLKKPPNSIANIIELYRKDTPFQFFVNNKTGEHFCDVGMNNKIPQREKIFKMLGPDARGTLALLYASCLGEGGQIERWLKDLFKNTGLYHLLVVSGFHLGLILILSGGLNYLILKSFPKLIYFIPKKSLKAVIGIVLTILFLSICETGKPLIRSAIIAFTISFSAIFNRKHGVTLGLLWSLAILSLIYPFCICEPGVQLSYGAITGVILGSNYAKRLAPTQIEQVLFDYSMPSFFDKIKEFFISSFFCSLGAFLFVSPIQYFWFGTFSVYSLLFNVIFAVPFSYLVVLPGFFVLIALWAWPQLGMVLLVVHSWIVVRVVGAISLLWEMLNG